MVANARDGGRKVADLLTTTGAMGDFEEAARLIASWWVAAWLRIWTR